MKDTVQGKVADEVLQRPEIIEIGRMSFRVPPPTTGTLIMASEELARFPEIKMSEDTLVYDVLREARRCEGIGRAVATILIGSKKIHEWEEKNAVSSGKRPCLLLRLLGRKNKAKEENPVTALARDLLDNASNRELHEAFAKLIQRMQLGDFFGLTTFLNAINQTKPTREVGTMTASGQ